MIKPDQKQKYFIKVLTQRTRSKQSYTDTEQVCKKILFVPIGITRSNQILLCKLDKNEYPQNF